MKLIIKIKNKKEGVLHAITDKCFNVNLSYFVLV